MELARVLIKYIIESKFIHEYTFTGDEFNNNICLIKDHLQDYEIECDYRITFNSKHINIIYFGKIIKDDDVLLGDNVEVRLYINKENGNAYKIEIDNTSNDDATKRIDL
jgi:hypothetical protein